VSVCLFGSGLDTESLSLQMRRIGMEFLMKDSIREKGKYLPPQGYFISCRNMQRILCLVFSWYFR
jgi:hypothetical protein